MEFFRKKSGLLILTAALGAFVFTFVIYFLKLAPTVYSGDSGDLVTAAFFRGVPHPPGYPFYTLIAHFFTLIPVNSVAWRVNLLSSVFQAATAPIVFLIIYRLTKKITPAAFGATFLAFSFTFWFYAEIAEVFALNTLFAATLILLAILARQSPKSPYLYSLAFLSVFSFFHHQTIVLIYPAIFVLIAKPAKSFFKARRRILVTIFFAILGFVPLLYFPFIANSASPAFWGEPINLANFLKLATRADYGTLQSSRVIVEPAGGRITHFFALLRIFLNDFTILGLILALFGFLSTLIRDKILGVFLLTGFLVSGPIFLMYANFPQGGAFEISVVERFTMLPAIFIVIAASLGVLYCGHFFSAILKNFSKIFESLKFFVPAILLLLPFFLFLENWQKIDLSGNFLGKTLAEDILANVPKNSLVLVRGDTIVFNTHYLHFVEKVRSDLKIVGPGILVTNWYYPAQLKRIYPELTIPQSPPDERLTDFIVANFEKHPIFQFGPQFEVEGFTAVPTGLGTRLYKADQLPENEAIFEKNLQVWQRFRIPQKTGYSDVLLDFSKKIYAEAAAKTANFFFNQDNFDESLIFYSKTLEIDQTFLPARQMLGKTYAAAGNCKLAEAEFEKSLEISPADAAILEDFAQLYRNCFKNENLATVFSEKAKEVRAKLLNFPSLWEF